MPYAAFLAAIKADLEAIPDVGIVTEYEPHCVREEDFRQFFQHKDLGYCQGWTITREATTEREYISTETNFRDFAFVIRGYRAIEDHGFSELAFQDLIDEVALTLRREGALQFGGTATFVGPPMLRLFEPRMFAGVLVHYAEIALGVTEHVQTNP